MSSKEGRSYRRLLWCLAIAGALLDQTSKYVVFRWLSGPEYRQQQLSTADFYAGHYEVIPGAFRLLAQFTRSPAPANDRLGLLRTWSSGDMPKVNPGALFGFLAEYAKDANTVFAAISVLAAIAITIWSCKRSTASDPTLCAALGLILGGTLGNLYDRVVFHGVRDFLYFYLINWPVFNIADCCLVCGAGLLLLQAFWPRAALGPPEIASHLGEAKAQAPA
jgi:lipoprotein signal peptidase